MGRHYCPTCGKTAGFRQGYSYKKAEFRWYQLAPVRLYCNACGAGVRGHLRPGIWPALLLLIVFIAGSLFAIESFAANGFISSRAGHVAYLILLGALALVGPYLIQHFMEYKNAPAP